MQRKATKLVPSIIDIYVPGLWIKKDFIVLDYHH